MRHPEGVSAPTLRSESPFALAPPAEAALERRIADALALARRDGRPAVASATQVIDPALDLSAAVLSSRRAGDRFFCMEQPGLEGHVVCGLGTVLAARSRRRGPVRAGGGGRPRAQLADARRRSRGRLGRRPAPGPVHVGGFAFSHAGGRSPEWAGIRARAAGASRGLVRASRRSGAYDGRGRRGGRRVARRADGAGHRAPRGAPRWGRSPLSIPTRSRGRGWRAPHRRPTTRRRSAARWSASARASWRRWCWRAR